MRERTATVPVDHKTSSLEDRTGLIRSVSPFRYPGGKSFLCDFLENRIRTTIARSAEYAEPFCGGAGAAALLLRRKVVEKIHLNDADPRIFSAWKAIVCETDRFVARLHSVDVNLQTWHAYSDLVTAGEQSTYDFDLGFATFFLNRTSRSGIVVGSGPIGGYDQTGPWKIDARFNRDTLAARIVWLGTMRDRIELSNEDALHFMQASKSRIDCARTLFFIDPPYVKVGGRLYLNAMNPNKHIALSDIIQSDELPHWVVTYDDHPLIREAYSSQVIDNLTVNYSLQKRRKENEILILPNIHAATAAL